MRAHRDICHHHVNGSDGIGGGRPGTSGRRQIANHHPIKNTSKKRNIRSPRCSLGSKIAEKSKTKNRTVPTCREVRSHSIPAFPESRSHSATALIDFILPPFRCYLWTNPRHVNPGSAQQEWRDQWMAAGRPEIVWPSVALDHQKSWMTTFQGSQSQKRSWFCSIKWLPYHQVTSAKTPSNGHHLPPGR
jgi:hypothetical protein